MTVALVILTTIWLAYANGANDNVKGVATLIGSRTMGRTAALRFAAVCTLCGSLCTALFAASLVRAFGGKGLVPDELLSGAQFPAAVLLASAATVMLATRLGLPISTTHAMMGALLGAGAAAHFSKVNFALLGHSFAAPLALSPALAATLTVPIYLAFRRLRQATGLAEDSCLCVGPAREASANGPAAVAAAQAATARLTVKTGALDDCRAELSAQTTPVVAGRLLDGLHLCSAGTLSFARGLNDTAKVIGPLMLLGTMPPTAAAALAGVAMAAGGLISAAKVARTMSDKITPMNQGQGFVGNAVAGALVIVASRLGLPVSTTHVSCGSIFGIGMVTRQANRGMIGTILAAWVSTLPLALGLGMIAYWIGSRLS